MSIPSCRDKALLVSGSNTANYAILVALLDPSFRPPLTHTSHHRPELIDLSRFRVSPILTHIRFMCFFTCVSGVSLVCVSLLSADVAVAMVRPDVLPQRVFISRGRTRAHRGKLLSRRTRSCNNPKIDLFVSKAGFASERLVCARHTYASMRAYAHRTPARATYASGRRQPCAWCERSVRGRRSHRTVNCILQWEFLKKKLVDSTGAQ
jgi:hypothetical protein